MRLDVEMRGEKQGFLHNQQWGSRAARDRRPDDNGPPYPPDGLGTYGLPSNDACIQPNYRLKIPTRPQSPSTATNPHSLTYSLTLSPHMNTGSGQKSHAQRARFISSRLPGSAGRPDHGTNSKCDYGWAQQELLPFFPTESKRSESKIS